MAPDHTAQASDLAGRPAGDETRPAGITVGPGHRVVYGNAAFRAEFGDASVGLPARESMLGLLPEAFALFDAVLVQARPFARWIRRGNETWRLTARPRLDPETLEPYGVAFHLRARSDLPIVRRPEDDEP